MWNFSIDSRIDIILMCQHSLSLFFIVKINSFRYSFDGFQSQCDCLILLHIKKIFSKPMSLCVCVIQILCLNFQIFHFSLSIYYILHDHDFSFHTICTSIFLPFAFKSKLWRGTRTHLLKTIKFCYNSRLKKKKKKNLNALK